MRLLTITELMKLTRNELCALYAEAARILDEEPQASPVRTTAQLNIRNIRWALGRRGPAP